MLAASRRLVALGLNRGTSGNVGVRHGDGLLVTPSGVPADELTPAAMVELSMDGQVHGSGKPSSEWRIHRDLLAARPEIHAVVHTHSPFATSLACLGEDIPAVHYMIAMAGGDSLRCAPYALFGTQELSDHALAALTDRRACLLANHGLIALGHDLTTAVDLALEMETLCEITWRARQAGTPRILDGEEMQAVIERFKDYGRRPSAT
jgi:L-fuculose-phosphate aldolase